ncbi:type III secretion system gatekeeper subunit SctW [Desulfovibrio sp. OttesenSCG-928-M14]|nr:type III secretion system gatekeeper subunit SctW [Desulfovibrio sp. OttesenSCG-928-M14]
MSQRVHDGPTIQPLAQDVGGSGQAVQQEGRFMGESVKVQQDASSLIQDAAEELTFSASEDVERKLSERKEGKDKARSLEYILFYVEKCQDMSQNDLEQLLKQLMVMNNARGANLANLVRQAFTDPTSQHAALSYARGKLGEQNLDPEKLRELGAALDEAIGILEEENGRAINAGYNIAGIQAPELGLTGPSLRVLYRDTVIDFESYEKTFGSMLNKFGPDEFPKAVEYLIRALGNDMSAVTPSSPKAALKEVMDGLYMVESLGTIYKEAANLLAKTTAQRGSLPGLSEKAIIEPLLRYKDLPMLMPAQVKTEMPFFVTDNAGRDAELSQGVRELARKMPHKLYVSPEARQNVLNAFQEILDDAADREELEMEMEA